MEGFKGMDLPKLNIDTSVIANSALRAQTVMSGIEGSLRVQAEYNARKDAALFETAEASVAQKELLEEQLVAVQEQNRLLQMNYDTLYVMVTDNENQNRVQYGDVLFTTSSETPEEVGTTSVLLSQVDELYLNSFCFGLRLIDFNTLLPEFAAYYFRGLYFRTILKTLAQGATRFNLSKSSLLKNIIVLPNIEIQRNISNILLSIDKIIELQKQKLTKIKNQQKSLMQLLLTGVVRV